MKLRITEIRRENLIYSIHSQSSLNETINLCIYTLDWLKKNPFFFSKVVKKIEYDERNGVSEI